MTFAMLIVLNHRCLRVYAFSARSMTSRLSPAVSVKPQHLSAQIVRHDTKRLFTTATSNEYDDTPLQKLTVKELKVKLSERGLPTSGLKAELIDRLESGELVSQDAIDKRPKKTAPKQSRSKNQKFTINPNWQTEFNANALYEEFDKIAMKDGFDASTAYYADDTTFEDDFVDDDFDDVESSGSDEISFPAASQNMEERMAAAKRDVSQGKISVPKSLDDFSQDATFESLKALGFRREVNPFGNDETPRREQFKVITNAMTCSGCGYDFQSTDELKPGFLPSEKYEVQEKLAKIEEAQKLQDKTNSGDWSPEDEIDYLLRQTDPDSADEEDDLLDITPEEMAVKMGLDLEILTRKKVLCKRCHGLQNFGTVEQKLRPGWTDEPTLSQEEFRKLLLPLKQKTAVILALVDLFDFSGSVLPELDEIAGDNPVILAANKADLLPSAMGQTRAENWVRRELEYMDVRSIANIGGAVRLVSCKTGFGVASMIEKAKSLASDMECDIYVVGAANAGKSTLVNYLLDQNNPDKSTNFGGKKRAGNANKWKGFVTTSPLPGTTLKFIKIELGDGKVLYDTPGLLIPGSLTDRLTPEELKVVVPKK